MQTTVQLPMPWINYVLMGVWVVFGISTVLGAIALWRIATLLRRIAFRMEHPTPVPHVVTSMVGEVAEKVPRQDG